MQFKKSWFGHSIFIIGTLLLSVYLYTLFVSLCMYMEKANDTYIKIHGIDVSFFLGGLFVLAFAGLFFLIEYIKKHILIKNTSTLKTLGNVFFWVSYVFLLGIGTYLRVANVLFDIESREMSDTSFYEYLNNQFLLDPNSYPNIVFMLYEKICIFLLRVFGLKEVVITYFNVALFLAASVLLFFTIKKVFGKLPALLSFMFLMIFEVAISFGFDTRGTVFWFFLVSVVVFIASYFADLLLEKKPVVYTLIMAGVILVLFGINYFLFYPLNLVFDFSASLYNFFISFYYVVAILLVLFAFYAGLGYLTSKKDKFSVAFLLTLLFTFLMYFDRSYNYYYIWFCMFICVLSGIGLRRFFFEGYKNDAVTESEPEETDEIVIVPDEEEGTANVVSIPAGKIDESKIKEVTFKAFDSEKKEIKFLDNPLPVPKKHVKKSIDYAFEPEANMMKYDIEISSDDDFDIK